MPTSRLPTLINALRKGFRPCCAWREALSSQPPVSIFPTPSLRRCTRRHAADASASAQTPSSGTGRSSGVRRPNSVARVRQSPDGLELSDGGVRSDAHRRGGAWRFAVRRPAPIVTRPGATVPKLNAASPSRLTCNSATDMAPMQPRLGRALGQRPGTQLDARANRRTRIELRTRRPRLEGMVQRWWPRRCVTACLRRTTSVVPCALAW